MYDEVAPLGSRGVEGEGQIEDHDVLLGEREVVRHGRVRHRDPRGPRDPARVVDHLVPDVVPGGVVGDRVQFSGRRVELRVGGEGPFEGAAKSYVPTVSSSWSSSARGKAADSPGGPGSVPCTRSHGCCTGSRPVGRARGTARRASSPRRPTGPSGCGTTPRDRPAAARRAPCPHRASSGGRADPPGPGRWGRCAGSGRSARAERVR